MTMVMNSVWGKILLVIALEKMELARENASFGAGISVEIVQSQAVPS